MCLSLDSSSRQWYSESTQLIERVIMSGKSDSERANIYAFLLIAIFVVGMIVLGLTTQMTGGIFTH